MIDFPASPTNGQQFSAAGVTWTWDGVKWTPVIGSIIGIPDAPVDGTTYGRKDASWAPAGGGSAGIPEAPNDGWSYARSNLGWVRNYPTFELGVIIKPSTTGGATLVLDKQTAFTNNRIIGS